MSAAKPAPFRSQKYARTGNADSMYAVYNASGMPFVEVTGADAIIIYVSLATDYKMSYASDWKGKDPAATNKKILAKALKKNYAELRKAHVAHIARRLAQPDQRHLRDLKGVPACAHLQFQRLLQRLRLAQPV